MTQLDDIFSDINKQYKEEIATKGKVRIKVPVIPFSSLTACYNLYGGIPRGRIVEFFGVNAGGKTTTALDVVHNAQILFRNEYEKQLYDLEQIPKLTKTQEQQFNYLHTRGKGKDIVWVDCENTFDEDWARTLGVDVDSIYFLQPLSQSAEEIFDLIEQMVLTGEVGLVVLDSLGAMVSKQQWEKSMEEKTYCGIAGPLTLFSKRIQYACAKTNCTFIGINQVQDDMRSQFNLYKTPGGNAWRHMCSVRLMFNKGNCFDINYKDLSQSAEGVVGNYVDFKVVKTKVCRHDRKNGGYTLNYTLGVDVVADLIELAVKYGLIVQTGAWYTILGNTETNEPLIDANGEIAKFNGKQKLIDYIRNDEDIYSYLHEKITNIIIE